MFYYTKLDNNLPMLLGSVNEKNRIPADCVEITEEEFQAFKELGNVYQKDNGNLAFENALLKIDELSQECSRRIKNNFVYNGEKYSLDYFDQLNINTMYQNAINNVPTTLTYHADNEKERVYTKEEMLALKQAMDDHIRNCRLQFNEKKQYLLQLGATFDDAQIIKSMNWESEVPQEFKVNL